MQVCSAHAISQRPQACDARGVTDLDKIRSQATKLLTDAPPKGAEGAAMFEPRPEDYAVVFTEPVAAAMGAHFKALWAVKPAILVHEGQSELRLWISLSEQFVRDTPEFPGGYKALAPYLTPGKVWISWKYTRPGAAAGMAYDGLVWLDDRFAWFPKPWRVLREVLPSLGIYQE